MVSSMNRSAPLAEKAIYTSSKTLHYVASVVLTMMMLLTAFDVIFRYFLNAPITGALELIEFMMAITLTFAFAWAVVQKDHISIDLLTARFSSKVNAFLKTTTNVFAVGLLVIITWQSLLRAHYVQVNGYVTQSLYIPEYPFVYAAAFGFGVFCLMMIFNVGEQIRDATGIDRQWAWFGLIIGILLILLFAGTPLFREMPYQLSPFSAGSLSIGILMIFIFSGMPLGVALGSIGFIGMIYLTGIKPGFSIMGTEPYRTLATYNFSVIPLFILMGAFCFHSGLSEDLYRTVHKFIGHLPGGLAMATVGACAGFAAVSGSGMATAATMGKVALPEMKKYKYDLRLAAGSIAAGGSIGILIPPSTILVIYGILTEQSIGKLFLAGFIPGILEALLYMLLIYFLCKAKPHLGPKGPKTCLKEKVVALKSTWGVLALFLIVIGGIYLGVFTPTEAAGVGAFGALLLMLIRGKFTKQNFISSLGQSVGTSGGMFFILVGAMIFGVFLARTRLPFELTTLVGGLDLNRYIILIMIIVLYLIIGAFLDIFSIVVITVPILAPIMEGLGFDLIWFGIIVVRLFEMGAITPPIGIKRCTRYSFFDYLQRHRAIFHYGPGPCGIVDRFSEVGYVFAQSHALKVISEPPLRSNLIVGTRRSILEILYIFLRLNPLSRRNLHNEFGWNSSSYASGNANAS
jgi:tripartite ATP-independent transporter DctM subunit